MTALRPASREKILINKLNSFTSTEQLAQFLLEKGKKLPITPREQFMEADEVRGCQSLMYCKVILMGDESASIQLYSDALISKGLAYLAYDIYSGSTLRDLLLFQSRIIEEVDLLTKLSIGRSHGLASLLAAIPQRAMQTIQKS